MATRLGAAGRSGKSSLDNAHTATTELSVVAGELRQTRLDYPGRPSSAVNVTGFGVVGPTRRLDSEPGRVAESASPARTSASAVGGVDGDGDGDVKRVAVVVSGHPFSTSVSGRSFSTDRIDTIDLELESVRSSTERRSGLSGLSGLSSSSSSHRDGTHRDRVEKVFRAPPKTASVRGGGDEKSVRAEKRPGRSIAGVVEDRHFERPDAQKHA